MHTYLENPIWEKLQQSTEYTMVFRSCSEVLPSKETFEGCPFRDIPLAVHVPMNPEEMVPEGAFAAVPRLRHVSVEAGTRVVGAEAWQCCRQLRIVRMPASVVRIADNTFRGRQLLKAAPYSGSMLLRAQRINFVVPPNLGTISLEIASTWPPLSCERPLIHKSCQLECVPGSCHKDASVLEGLVRLSSRGTSKCWERTHVTTVNC